MDVQSGESEEEEVVGEGIGKSKWRNWYQSEVEEETKGADSRDKVKHNEKCDQLFLFKEDDKGGPARVTTDEELALHTSMRLVVRKSVDDTHGIACSLRNSRVYCNDAYTKLCN